MNVTTILWTWTVIGVTWWVVAFVLARVPPRRKHRDGVIDRRRLTVFKPLARLGEGELDRLRPCLESFVAALDEDSELILGCHEWDERVVEPFVAALRARYPHAALELVVNPNPNHHANPKVAWMEILARHATGELWLWSDADMRAPADAIRSLRADLAASGAGLVTSPYFVDRAERAPGLLDALFVNLEFFPGVMLLGRLGLVRFGFGSGMLFEAADFRRRVDWDDLGSYLAEDFQLGRRLAPARLGSTRLVTSPASDTWKGAILHYLRWQKTIRWCRPGSFAAQLTILPILGWSGWLLLQPGSVVAWLGLLAVILADAAVATAVCRVLGCPVGWRRWHLLPVWSVLRGVTWVACWLPWPIVWRGKRWWSPRLRTASARMLETETRIGLD